MLKKQIKELKPLYYDQFQCIGGACEDTCCASWNITIDKKSYQKYKNEKHPDLKPLFKENIQRNKKSTNDHNYAHFKLDENKACGMLSDDGLCTIHTTLGGESLCHTCQVFPRDLKVLNHTSEKSLDMSCPEAARLILLNENGIDFIEDYTDNLKLSLNQTNHKNPDVEAFFWTNRMFFISALQHRKYTIEIRLMIIGLYVKKLESLTTEEQHIQSEALSQRYLKLLDNDDTASLFDSLKPRYNTQLALVNSFIKNSKSTNSRFNELTEMAYTDSLIDNDLNAFIETIQKNKI